MKKVINDKEMLSEYDFSKGERGKYAKRYHEGVTIGPMESSVESEFNLDELKKETSENNRFEKRLKELSEKKQDVNRIEQTVNGAIENIKNGERSFVIYGEPQSGKTEMMIALTAKLLDFGFQIIIVLLNDSVQLLGQNLERFQRSGLSPTPQKFSEILSEDVVIGDHKWVIFSKKNSKDLEKLWEKLKRINKKVVIDDEADFATPNSKINQKEKSKINELTERLIKGDGIYIGVTATPARLDLNRTHDNQNEKWIDFPPHDEYTGQDVFFPATVELSRLGYQLKMLPAEGDYPKYLREALFSFMVNVAYLNTRRDRKEENFYFLIHTSGKKVDHSEDYKRIVKTLRVLKESQNDKHSSYYHQIWDIAKNKYPGEETIITKYILGNKNRNHIVVMNSDKEKNVAGNETATNPTTPFTIVIGGNIVSRGVTFNNLLSMFFTRDVKHKLQQDTYVQRARMFGSRNSYLKYFELTIPENLYLDWQQCFIFHKLSLNSRRSGSVSPVWLENQRIAATSGSSIDRARVAVDRGEMSFEMFDFKAEAIEEILGAKETELDKLKKLSKVLGNKKMPDYLINYIEHFTSGDDKLIAIHEPRPVPNYSGTDQTSITRARGFIGKFELEEVKFPNAIHHIFMLYNEQSKARIFYKYQGNVSFLRMTEKK